MFKKLKQWQGKPIAWFTNTEKMRVEPVYEDFEDDGLHIIFADGTSAISCFVCNKKRDAYEQLIESVLWRLQAIDDEARDVENRLSALEKEMQEQGLPAHNIMGAAKEHILKDQKY